VKAILARWGIFTVAVLVATSLVDGFDVDGRVLGHVAFAAVLGLVNALIRPIVRLLALPIRLATLGLASVVIDGLLLILAAWPLDFVEIDGLLAAVVTTLLLSLLATVLNWLLIDRGTP
jgi:putative membrane protein